jgi:hypothetical protein
VWSEIPRRLEGRNLSEPSKGVDTWREEILCPGGKNFGGLVLWKSEHGGGARGARSEASGAKHFRRERCRSIRNARMPKSEADLSRWLVGEIRTVDRPGEFGVHVSAKR